MCHIFNAPSSVDGYLGHFHSVAIVTNASMNIGVHVFFCIMLYSDVRPGEELLDHMVVLFFSFLRNLHTVPWSLFSNIADWFTSHQFSSVQTLSCVVVSNSLQPHESQHSRLPCSSSTPRNYSNSCPLSQWCHPTISSYVVPVFCCWGLLMDQNLVVQSQPIRK